MVKSFVRRPVTWMLLVGLLMSVFAFSACNTNPTPTPTPTPTPVSVNIRETQAASGDTYTCDPTSITVTKGDTLKFINNSDENQVFDKDDTQNAGGSFTVNKNSSTDVTFNNSGIFKITSEKGATIMVTVD